MNTIYYVVHYSRYSSVISRDLKHRHEKKRVTLIYLVYLLWNVSISGYIYRRAINQSINDLKIITFIMFIEQLLENYYCIMFV